MKLLGKFGQKDENGNTNSVSDFRSLRNSIFRKRPDTKKLAEEIAEDDLKKRRGTAAELLSTVNIPLTSTLIRFLCEHLESMGVESVEGIFRVPGAISNVLEIYSGLRDFGLNYALPTDVSAIHDVASTLKHYLRTQQSPLIPFEFYKQFIQTQEDEDSSKRIEQLKKLCNLLPEETKDILHILMQLLRKISLNSEVNKMNTSNIAVVFGPVVLRQEDKTDMSLIFDVQNQCKVIEDLIEFDIMDDHSSKSGSKASNSLSVDSASNSKRKSSVNVRIKSKNPGDLVSFCVAVTVTLEQKAEQVRRCSRDLTLIAGDIDLTKPHELEKLPPNIPIFCSVCKKLIFTDRHGMMKGSQCKDCKSVCHDQCLDELKKSPCRKKRELKAGETVIVGDFAPDFSAPDESGQVFSLSNTLKDGKKVILFFYPLNFSPNFDIQRKDAFRDLFYLFFYAGCVAVAISSNPLDQIDHVVNSFAKSYNLPFILLHDKNDKIRKLYGVPDYLNGLVPGRVTYIISSSGEIVHMHQSIFDEGDHIIDSIQAISELLAQEM